MTDRSNGYECIAAEFIRARSATIGVKRVRDWAKSLPRGAAVVDLGCGPGFPITEVLVAEGLRVYGVDAAPSLVKAFRRNLPNTPVACEAVQDSKFFDRSFEGVLAWGLIFLLSPEDQRRLIQRISDILVPGGRLLFTSPAEIGFGDDVLTRLETRSLGAEEYRRRLSAVGLAVAGEYEDEGGNHYFEVFKELKTIRPKSEMSA
jgi:SAM-dependent methyltransferase